MTPAPGATRPITRTVSPRGAQQLGERSARGPRAATTDEADAAVEGLQHLGLGDAGGLAQPAEDRRQAPGVEVDVGAEPLGQDARQVLGQPAAGDVGDAADARRRGCASSAGRT